MIFTEVQKQLIESAEKYFGRGRNNRPFRFGQSTWQELEELGWLGMLLPESCGGAGMDAMDSGLLCERMGFWLYREPFVLSGVIPSVLIQNSVRLDIATKLLEGKSRVLFAWQSKSNDLYPDWQSASVKSTGNSKKVYGSKINIHAWDGGAELLVCGNQEGQSCLIAFNASAEGVVVRQRTKSDGTITADVTFDGVVVNENAIQILSQEGQQGAARAVDTGRVVVSAQLSGLARGALHTTVSYINQREQFGQKISSFQAIRHRVANVAMEIELSSSAWRSALEKIESNECEPKARDYAISTAAISSVNAAMSACRECIQMHGAIGYTEDADPGQYLNAALTWRSWVGNLGAHKEIIQTNLA